MKTIRLIGLIGLMLCTGCASRMINEDGTGWSRYGQVVDWAKGWHGSEAKLIEPVEPVEPIEPEEPTEPVGLMRFDSWNAPSALTAPRSQEMRVVFANGYIQFWMMHVADHWGHPGSGWGILSVDGVTDHKYPVNIDLRHGRAIRDRMTRVDPHRMIPAGSYAWRKWSTAGGKTMFCADGIDLFGLQVVTRYAEDLGLKDVLRAESVAVIWR